MMRSRAALSCLLVVATLAGCGGSGGTVPAGAQNGGSSKPLAGLPPQPPPTFTSFAVGSNAFYLAFGPDGALWFTTFSCSNGVGRVTLGGSVSHFQLQPDLEIAWGPDGRLWFASIPNNNNDVFLDAWNPATGQVSKYGPAPKDAEGVTPFLWGGVVGSDGNIWYGGGDNDSLVDGQFYRVAPATGAITVFSIPVAGSEPYAMALGPDGNIWASDYNITHQQLYSVSPSGSISIHPLTGTTGQITGLATGADRALWFTEYDANKIGRMDLNGAVTQYPLPQPSQVHNIVLGSDGAMYFLENAAPYLGRITTTGQITQYPIPLQNGDYEPPYDIVTGPDDAVWMSDGSEMLRFPTPSTPSV